MTRWRRFVEIIVRKRSFIFLFLYRWDSPATEVLLPVATLGPPMVATRISTPRNSDCDRELPHLVVPLRQSNFLTKRQALCSPPPLSPPLVITRSLRPTFNVGLWIASRGHARWRLWKRSQFGTLYPHCAYTHVTRKTVQELRVVWRRPKRQLFSFFFFLKY